MSPGALTCISCNTTFPANRELASVPDAATVAFDPARRRAWRICSKCGEWNLLGPEASAAALPELEARFAASPHPQGEMTHSIATLSPRLELLRLEQRPAPGYNSEALTARARWTLQGRAFGLSYLAGSAVLLVALFAGAFQQHFLARILAEYLWLIPLAMLSGEVVKLRLKLPVRKRDILLWFGLYLGAIAFDRLLFKNDVTTTELIRGAVIMALAAAFAPAFAMKFVTADGRIIRFFTKEQMRAVTMSWDENRQSLTLHDLPSGELVGGDDARKILKRLVQFSGTIRLSLARPRNVDSAVALLRSAGGLPGVLRSLDGLRRDRDGRVAIGDLPTVYRLALDFGIAAYNEHHRDVEIDDRLERAQVVALEAEALADGADR